MKIINPKVGNIEEIIQPIDDLIILGLSRIAFKCKKATESYNLRDELYASKYKPTGLERKEIELEQFLQQQVGENLRTKNQNKEYKWVIVNEKNIRETSHRFYIAPNPENMHEIVSELVKQFVSQNIPVKFKYQLTSGMEQCDRIIIYSDFDNKDRIESEIKKVYQQNQNLFNGCERSLAWLYTTTVPDVYLAPETPGEAYSNRVAEVILTAKNTFNFLYGITNSNQKITLAGKNAEQALEEMKILIGSLMLRKGILLSKDGKCITIKDKNVKTLYDFNSGILENYNMDSRGFYSVKFFPTAEGRKALLNHFYGVSSITKQPGLEIKYLTLEQRKEEVDRNLYPYRYINQQTSAQTINHSPKR